MKTVFILGAGASKAAGAPLMADFLDKARDLHESNAFGSDQDAVKDVLNAAHRDLKAVHATATFNHRNIEELFSAVDIAQTIGKFAARTPEQITELRDHSIPIFIARTLEETICISKQEGSPGYPKGYDILAKQATNHIKKIRGTNSKPVSFITFNYDTALEFSLVKSGLAITYGLSEPFADAGEEKFRANIPESARTSVLKLHGSTNWGYCRTCKKVVPTEIDEWRNKYFAPAISEMFAQTQNCFRLKPTSRLTKFQHSCGQTLFHRPFIVPPTWNKTTEYEDLKGVWRQAAVEIGKATCIVVIGYSFPATDMFFKYLFALGTMSGDDTQLRRFIVINGGNRYSVTAGYRETIERLRNLLGPTNRHGFQSTDIDFEGAEAWLRELLPA